MRSICFNLLDAHALLVPGSARAYGGAEVRGTTIAKELAARGIETTIVVREDAATLNITAGNLTLRSHGYYGTKGMPAATKLRLSLKYALSYRRMQISKDQFYKWYPYIEADAEYYAAFEITELTKQLVQFCKQFHKKFLLFIASDGELSFEKETASAMATRKELAAFVVGQAAQVFVQNAYQQTKLGYYFGKEGVQINNPLPLGIEQVPVKQEQRSCILWVGKSSAAKQPMQFVELAKAFPNEQFVMVMNHNQAALHESVRQALPANVTFYESLPFAELNQVFNRSKWFVSTSLYEGFPNTFLQAGYFSVPVISLHVNPNEFISRYACGVYCGGSEAAMKAAIQDTTPGTHALWSDNIKQYVQTHHAAVSVASAVTQALQPTPVS